MSGPSDVLGGALLVVCLAPLCLFIVLAGSALLGGVLKERGIGLVTRGALTVAFVAAGVAFVAYLAAGSGPVLLSFGSWFAAGDVHFAIALAVDGLSLGFVLLALAICNVVAAFSFRYLHLEPGFKRYFVQMAMFVAGITLVALAGSIEVLFVGWELLGLSSALLVGFFHERKAPVHNALRVFAIYRVSDAAMLSAAVLLHHFAGSGSLTRLLSSTAEAGAALGSSEALAISILLIVAVAAKSALWPFSGWLPRAMEGPTPSSAVYYGALSIHAGCYLLLRVQPLLAESRIALGLVIGLGVLTTVYAGITVRVQTDAKSALCYAALTQVGIIVVEIALGLKTLAFLHIVGHACFRLLQFLSVPNTLHDLHELQTRLGGPIPRGFVPPRRGVVGRAVYFLALERALADALLDAVVVGPFLAVAARLDRIDRWLAGSLKPPGGGQS